MALVVVVQEQPDGTTFDDAVRVWPDASSSSAGPRSRSLRPAPACLSGPGWLRERGAPARPRGHASATSPSRRAGYGGDPDWGHGRWRGRGWVECATYDLRDPAVAARVPFGVVDHVARATLDGEEGWGLLEHGTMGRHDPSGFADWDAVAP